MRGISLKLSKSWKRSEIASKVGVFTLYKYYCLTSRFTDRTQVFHDQIEVKQKELQPWTVQINQKQADINVAKSEREALKTKAEAAKSSLEGAQTRLEELRDELETKSAMKEQLQTDKANNEREIKEAEREHEVPSSLYLPFIPG